MDQALLQGAGVQLPRGLEAERLEGRRLALGVEQRTARSATPHMKEGKRA